MGSWMGLIGSVVVVIAALAQCTAAQTTYIVGDSAGWTVRSYDSWLSGKTFALNDKLNFTFNAQFHDVAQVSKTNYDACTNTSTSFLSTTSPTIIPLNTTGEHYYICTFPGHCLGGQQLSINVVSSTTESPGPSPPPTAGSTPPSPGSVEVNSTENGVDSKGGSVNTTGGGGRSKSEGTSRSNGPQVKIIIIGSVSGAIVLILACIVFVFFIRKSVKRTNDSKNNATAFSLRQRPVKNVEAFLQNCGSLAPKRYRYSKLKKITNSFKDKLGEGGYGGVFKGKLKDGRLVAVKVLNNTKGNGEEFINEVASIGRTYHVNIVTLIGFCYEGSKRALIYEFMSNGSLEKFIYSNKSEGARRALTCERLFQIAVGIARGLEYLHRGCSTRILHFDIKPHNILLDDEFCPKISDFGLAKLCPNHESIISMQDARGTMGYIAPEVYCRNIGGVSHKSDVYSYGMMVLEMVGGRKNIDAQAENTSEIYFPHWVYNHIALEDSFELIGILEEEEREIARKMVLVGLWCIQTNPTNRPSMSKVVEMLEGSVQGLEIPPKPYLSSP